MDEAEIIPLFQSATRDNGIVKMIGFENIVAGSAVWRFELRYVYTFMYASINPGEASQAGWIAIKFLNGPTPLVPAKSTASEAINQLPGTTHHRRYVRES